jgi:hypothetical protein
MTAKVTERVDALNGESGQVLHLRISLSRAARKKTSEREKNDQRCEIVAPGSLWCQGEMAQDVAVWLQTEENVFLS